LHGLDLVGLFTQGVPAFLEGGFLPGFGLDQPPFDPLAWGSHPDLLGLGCLADLLLGGHSATDGALVGVGQILLWQLVFGGVQFGFELVRGLLLVQVLALVRVK